MSSEFPSTPLVIRKAVDLSAGSVLLDALLGADYERRPEDVDAVRASCRDVRLCDAEMDWRISPIGTGRTIREYESIIRRASFRQFAEWLNAGADTELQTDHPFADLPKYSDKEVSIYADYKHFNELFGSSSACINDKYIGFYGSKVILVDGDQKREIISWNEIMRKGHVTSIIEDSSIPTLWLSSDKAHSPLHYDTYGKNIVVQMSGRKRWLLWPASSPVLVPLRIPFEESSVYSEFDPLEFMSRYGTDEEGIMAMRTAHPGLVEVVLEPGDALLVPPHVWHFVETCAPLALSVNLWIPNDPFDARERVKEAATRYIFGAMKSSLDQCGIDSSGCYSGWSNPSEHMRSRSGDSCEGAGHGTQEEAQNDDMNNMFMALEQLIRQGLTGTYGGDDIDCLLQDNYEEVMKCLVDTVLQPDVMHRFVNKIESELLRKLNK